MAGYVVADAEVTDEDLFTDYLERVPAVVADHGGKYVVRGGATEVVQGDWTPHRTVVIEFDNVEQARAHTNSSDYAELGEIRSKSSKTNVIIVDGV